MSQKSLLLHALAVGALTGLLVLGVGGRIVMRFIAEQAGQPPALTFAGTFTVVIAGIASGIGGALVRGLLELASWLPRIARTALFVAFCVLITLRGLRPVDQNRLLMFMPLVAIYAISTELLVRRRSNRRNQADMTPAHSPNPMRT